jgi:hypothetical protein
VREQLRQAVGVDTPSSEVLGIMTRLDGLHERVVEADREVSGRFDRTTGVTTEDCLTDPEIDDIAEAVILTGGEVVVVLAERMPTASGVAATSRSGTLARR